MTPDPAGMLALVPVTKKPTTGTRTIAATTPAVPVITGDHSDSALTATFSFVASRSRRPVEPPAKDEQKRDKRADQRNQHSLRDVGIGDHRPPIISD